MKRRQFWNVVPQPAKVAAFAILGLGVLIGLAAGVREGLVSGQLLAWDSLLGTCVGLFLGSLVALWILCLGYVYADARRRAMPPIPWTLIAALVPNLLGFLFYFALRRPLISPCAQCGRPGEIGRFCSSCGFDKLASASGNASPQPVYTGLDSNPV